MRSPIIAAILRAPLYFIACTTRRLIASYRETARQYGPPGCRAHGSASPHFKQTVTGSQASLSRHDGQTATPSLPQTGQ
jgi:hypothetical protein